VILDGGNVFIGVNADNEKQIILEDIRNKKPPEIIVQHEHDVSSLLVNKALNILWAGDKNGNIFQYVLGPGNAWKVQAKYSALGIGEVRCLSRFGNLLFAGGNDFDVCVINTSDKEVLPMTLKTAIQYTYSLQVCAVSPSETYLTVTGADPSYSDPRTDLFDVSKFQQLSSVKKIFSEPELHLNSIHRQFNNNSKKKEEFSIKCDDSNLKNQ
jgi:hypothetical protein